MRESKFSTIWIYGILFIVVLSIIAALTIQWAHKSQTHIPRLYKVTPFEFSSTRSDMFKSSDMLGKINIVDFIFTNCQSACPIMSQAMAELYQDYSYTKRVQFLSISVDPKRDSIDVLRQYGKTYGVVDDRWIFLKAPIDKVIELSEQVFKLSAENLPMGHSTKFVLVDPEGWIRGYYDALNDKEMQRLKQDIVKLAKSFY